MSPKFKTSASKDTITTYCTPIIKTVLFTLAKKVKQPKCPLTNKQNGAYTNKKYDTHMLSKTSQSRKKHCMILLT